MRVNFETRLKIFFVLIIAGIIGIALFTYQYFQSVKQLNSALSRSNQLHSLSQSLLIDLQDLELHTRAFALSADSNYLAQYQLAKSTLHNHLEQISNLTRENTEFQRRLHTLTILINQKIVYTNDLIEVTNRDGITGGAIFFKTSPASDLMQDLRFTLKTIQSKEDHMLKQRNREYELQLLNLRYTYYGLLVSLLAAVCIIGYFTIYQTRLRKIRERKLRESERRLDRRVKESLDEIEKQYEALREIAEIQSHQVRAPVATILGLINLFNFKNPADPNNQDILQKLKTSTEAFDKVIEEIVKMTNEISALRTPER
jgi:CHASE3 domain sensor protein